MKMQKNVFLAGKEIYLRALEITDADTDYPSWLNDADVCAGNSHHIYPYNRQACIDYIINVEKSKAELILAIVTQENNKHIGNIALQNINPIYRSAEFAILIGDRDSWGKGFGKQAAELIIRHGFKNINLNRIYCGTFENNIGMQKLANNIGMTQTGRQRKAIYKDGDYQDMLQYDLLASEYEC